MGAPFGYSFFLFLKNNPIAQGIAVVGVFLALAWLWLWRHDAYIRKQERLKAEARAQKAKKEALNQLEKSHEKRSERVRRSVDAVRNDESGELPEHLSRFVKRDEPSGGGGF